MSAARVDAVDALRALALLAVLSVNLGGYASLPFAGPLSAPQPSDGLPGVLLTALVAGLLLGKGIALLTFLFGYSLAWGHAQPRRLRRLALLGALHGFFVYLGDILSQYAVFGAFALRRRRERLRKLLRRAAVWAVLGLLMLVAVSLLPAADEKLPPLLSMPSAWSWLGVNALGYVAVVVGMLLVYGPWSYALVLLGQAAARLRLLQHRRWRRHWQRAARWAGVALLVNLGCGAAQLADLQRSGQAVLLVSLLSPLTLLSWVPWLLLRAPSLPRWLCIAGRQTLTLYVGSSLIGLLLFTRWALGWTPPLAGFFATAFAVWSLGMACSAWAGARGRRLPLEAWLARRPA